MLKSWIAVALICMSLPAVAGQGAEKLDKFLHDLDTVAAKFEQSILDIDSANVGRFQGDLFISRPGKFRWDYFEPYEKQILADGKTVYVIDNDLEQITYVPQKRALKGTPASVLIDQGRIEDRFEVIDIGESQGMDWVELIPLEAESQFTRILLAFSNNELRRMEMADKFGQITRFQFFDIQRNPELDEELFVFKRRQGYDLLEND